MIGYNLSKYLKVKLDTSNGYKRSQDDFIITLSRDYGCDGEEIAEMVISKLNKIKSTVGKPIKWKLISKEILKKSAEELQIHPGNLETIVTGKNQGFINEILLSFSNQYPNDIKVKNTIRDVIENAAREGNVLILGRGGEVITHERPNSVHVKVTAPVPWRVSNLVKRKNITKAKATKMLQEIDSERDALKNYFLKDQNDDILYDLIFNRKMLRVEEIADIIISTLNIKRKRK